MPVEDPLMGRVVNGDAVGMRAPGARLVEHADRELVPDADPGLGIADQDSRGNDRRAS